MFALLERESQCNSTDHLAAGMGLLLALVVHIARLSQAASYASALGITASQLGRLSRDIIGLSPLEFINARLVREAQRDLAYTGLSV